MMDAIHRDIPHMFVYLDNILVASTTPEEHLKNLKVVFKILKDNRLLVNREKCILGVLSPEFLDFRVDKEGIPLEEQVATICQESAPTTVKELQRFLEIINFYRRFIKHATHQLMPLFNMLSGNPKNSITQSWGDSQESAFNSIKNALADATKLHHLLQGTPLSISTDASQVTLGAVLEQFGPSGWEPLAFYSKKLVTKQSNYPIFC